MSNRITPGSDSNLQIHNDNDITTRKPNPPEPTPAKSRPVPKVTPIPYRLRKLEPIDPAEIINDDPVFKTPDAARILGVRVDRLEKWRQRGQGPDYLRYDRFDIRYELSALIQYKAAHRVRSSRQPGLGKG
jgi:hypothetical protein